ncbi:membrane-bound serine protease (ClpP class) [Methylohalomonas lacus]|uniref:Membrane-bound serine protease (ClpP class) n=1 Tax=Methylohalomonas lacus TaxID=398773 RepID=A0AAE3HMI5_9GAMM|nr:NfeD family protein [Methylohalomonas lacus]MCS3904083.1 membrane-bound serine protease (ClpP class) [Methylohalomonas lacus]
MAAEIQPYTRPGLHPGMTALTRYILVQIPGWLLLICLLGWAVAGELIGLHLAFWIMAGWLIKDAALYPLCRLAFTTGPATGARALLGATAQVVAPLAPEGQIRIKGERWLARSHDETPIHSGQRVRVVDNDGLVLIVEPLDPSESGQPA